MERKQFAVLDFQRVRSFDVLNCQYKTKQLFEYVYPLLIDSQLEVHFFDV
jgi:hypothetical protein